MENRIFNGIVSTLAFGGSGIVKDEGFAIFCPFTIPGEKVEGKITQLKRNYAVGEVTQIIEPSKLRIIPRCPYFGVCGGCQLQHMPLEEQLQWKKKWVKEALERVGGFEDVQVEDLKPSKPWAYRRRISLTLVPQGNHYRAGYIGLDGRHFVETKVCPIFVEETNPVLEKIQSIVHELNAQGRERAKLSVLKVENEQFILEFHFKKLPLNAEGILKGLIGAKNSPFKGILCRSPSKTLKWGDFSQSFEFEGLEFAYSSGAFVQTHPDQSLAIYKEVLDFVQNHAFSHLLDLYSGIGITSLLLSKPVKEITSIELDPEAVKLAKQNGKMNRVKNVKFLEGSVEERLLQVEGKVDAILLNPPREGAGAKVMEQIVQLRPKNIIYISCMPATLARDLKVLREKGYNLKDCKPFDMFPQTTHVETFVTLELV